MIKQKFKTELKIRQKKIVELFLDIYIALIIVVIVNYIQDAIFNSSAFTSEFLLPLSITVILLVLTLYFRFVTVRRNYKILFIFLATISTLAAIQGLITNGLLLLIPSILVLTFTISLAVVISVRAARLYWLVTSCIYIIILFIHSFGLISYEAESTETDAFQALLVILFFWIAWRVSKIGYSEIVNSYNKALDYSNRLEKLNKELDQKVIERTDLLKENFSRQAEVLYHSAVIGNIARPLLHDIATPLSSIKGIIGMLQREKTHGQGDSNDLIQLAHESIDEITLIIEESRELIRGNEIISTFKASKITKNVVNILKSQFMRNSIKWNVTVKEDFKIKGTVSLIERVVLNILLNATEELRNKPVNRLIEIYIKTEKGFGIISIKDNGKGISKHLQKEIFKEDYSLKNTSHNLGLGLPFVKKIITGKFNGDIDIQSEVEKYTQFNIRIPIYNE